MKEIVIISGKGGTGKTSITASFATLSKNAVLADCDVDAADLHLLLAPSNQQCLSFVSGHIARIDAEKCRGCGTCLSLCRYDAILLGKESETASTGQAGTLNTHYSVIASACEGCKVCVTFCPVQAIDFPERRCGEWYKSTTRCGPMVHARLDIGAENSGKLVSLVRQQAREVAKEQHCELILVDGPPGIGCPVIAATTGATAVFVITEPTCSGKHDLLRVLELTSHFNIPAYVCVNKWDINPAMTEEIHSSAHAHGAQFIGTIPYDAQITAAQIAGKTIVEYGDSIASIAIRQIWQKFCTAVEI